ncbi:MAG: thioredoxin fold domain-containing protein [Pseudomonadota bacterium]|nr:thioredoxin fold domain-containing protein [Pseudomonadota bacterium]
MSNIQSVMTNAKRQVSLGLLLLLCLIGVTELQAQTNQISRFIDKPLEEPVSVPDWFKLSFLDLYDDIDEATADGKDGLIVYFGQKHCPYCKAHMEINWGNPDIVKYTRDRFDVIAIDVKGSRNITTVDGHVYEEKEFSVQQKTNFTPSLLFYNDKKEIVLKLQGYHPPYRFRAALEFVSDRHYEKETFREYLSRAELADSFGKDKLNQHTAFMPAPYILDRSKIPASRPLAVFFEQPRCHACDVLHAGPLSNDLITTNFKKMDVVQLNMQSETRLMTPDGRNITAAQWARELDLYYAPTIIFFDEQGKEILRINSVVWLYRLKNVLEYILSGAHKNYETYQLWRQHKGRQKAGFE